MFVVALLRLRAAPDDEAQALAVDLGVTAFEAGQLVRGILPSIVLKTPRRARVVELLGKLRQRGHDAVACDAGAVAASEAMHGLRGFRFEGELLLSLNQNGSSERLPWCDVIALVRATHRSAGGTLETSRERKLNLGRALLTQGLSSHKTVTKGTMHKVEQREPVLYLYRRDGPPWLASESRCRYEGLGAELRPGRLENFNTLVRLLRERLPAVPYDERLIHVRGGGERVQGDLVGAQSGSSNVGAVDLLAHLVAMSIVKLKAAQ